MKRDKGERIILFSLAWNAFLLLLKGTVGILGGSQALQADAINSAGDVLTTAIILLGVRFSQKPSDEDHPYGHGKLEALSSLLVGVFILLGVGFLWREIVMTVINRDFQEPSVWALVVSAAAIGIKYYLYRKTLKVGKQLNSIAVIANAKDHYNDVCATSGTLVAVAFGLAGARYGIEAFHYVEPAAAGIMSVFIVKSAVEIMSAAVKMLMDAAPDKDKIAAIEASIRNCEGLEHINWIRCRQIGRGYLVDMAVEVDGDLTVTEGHAIADAIMHRIHAAVPEVLDVLVHINPHTS
jgi:cation diffusion facilitator family transporter